jgi:predicted phage terminase large subunit-like protein
MPANNSIRPNDGERLAGLRKQLADPTQNHPVDGLKWQPTGPPSSQHNDLLPQHEDLGFQRRARSEQIEDNPDNYSAEIQHPAEHHPILRLTPTGRNLRQGQLNLPAIAQREETYFLGDGRTYDRQKGELLHPEHEPAHVLAELRREMGPIAFSAQYQQSPIPPGGTIIKRKWLTTYDKIDRQPGDRIIMSWDIALSEAETGDYTACVVLLRRNEVSYVLEVVRGRFPFDTLKRKVMEVKQRYGSSTLLIEDSPISRGLIQSLREQSISVTCYKPDTDKRARVIAQTDLFAAGSVRLPQRAAWLEDFTAELLAFPGRHDDQVDALTQGLAWGRQRQGEVSWGIARGMY